MPPTAPPLPPHDDFALLHAGARSLPDRGRWTVLWMMGLAGLIVAAVLALVWYLNRFESDEEARRRSADAQWLEQSVQFHFRRLEGDVEQLARQAALDGPAAWAEATRELPAGLLWRAAGVVDARAWLAEQDGASAGDIAAWQEDQVRSPDNHQALQTLEDIVRGLRRASYAGPMRAADGSGGDHVWLAMPYFDGARLLGLYVVRLSMRRAVAAMLPPWFLQHQSVRLVDDSDPPSPALPQAPQPYRTVLNLPGTDLLLEVVPQGARTSWVPRVFFLVALVFLLGMLASLAALRRDFIKRQQVQQRLQAEVALRTAMERSVSIGMRAWDMQGQILYVNQAFCSMLGFSGDELRGSRAPLPYWPAEQLEQLHALHQDMMRAGTRPQGVEAQFRHKDGHLVDVLIHEAPLHAADGTQLGWMSSILDISERKRAQQLAASQQEKLEASARLVAVGEVASTLAHELNQPLGALSSFANGLLNRLARGPVAPDELQAVVRRMAALAERAGGVTQRVNAFARRRELKLQRLDLVPLVRRAAAAAQEAHGAAALQLALPEAPVWVQGDALLLEHLVHNLCGNALDWARHGGGAPRVQLRLTLCDGATRHACLAVADSGPGVPEEARGRIFDAFYSTKEGGMGMGLAICRSIAEAHHGRILVGADAQLGGALFTAELPLADAAPPPPAPTLPHD
ncbi:two-component system, LuxR family, sensor histidine kinase DctS [Oryzisolibacter propanilivorax]|uniref:histidine kinase n=1 Tax=Oryzisolibacter propanilivorax TaxID=1527607 RepID=A0A1G9RFH6_9BURK|nr:PAS domain-containing sensor histidine kinase [Oryzisolibacter propanilivorax]SDM22062.1 two-component system, LuxR family, sensor histidine kinase DctS [Oryzisolibacter propanilivorax]